MQQIFTWGLIGLLLAGCLFWLARPPRPRR